jgi:glucuronosyltransferase
LRSVLQASLMTEKSRKTFLGVFGKLKQKVLWKWETEEMADKPSNVKLVKWLPQQDILGHKATRLFITHSGQSSTQGRDSLNVSGANHEMHATIYGSAEFH